MGNKKNDIPFNLSQNEWDEIRQEAKIEITNNQFVSNMVRAEKKQKIKQKVSA